MRTIHSILPDVDALLALEPEEVAGLVLEHLNSLEPGNKGGLNRYNFGLGSAFGDYPSGKRSEVAEALMEGWMWLEREGFIAPRPGESGEWFFITRRGRRTNDSAGLRAYQKSAILPRGLLHPLVAQKCWAAFLRGDYDTAVFQAFKELEVAVRAASRSPPELVGVDLMRQAFHSKSGPLTDSAKPIAEREALAHLMAGAIGMYKNPHSHRAVLLEAEEASEMLGIASHLLKIVDARAAT